MKLIIDIPEELYDTWKGRPPMLGDAGMDMIAQAIANGTPLQTVTNAEEAEAYPIKGDNEDWINTFIHKFNEDKDYKITDVRDREKLLDELRPKGEWKGNNYDEHVCSICGHYALYGEEPDDYYEEQSNFCPFCGAKMKKEAEND